MTAEKAYEEYTNMIEGLLAKRKFVRETYLAVLKKSERAKAEKEFGEYGTGSQEERERIQKYIDEKFNMFLEDFYKNEVIENKGVIECLNADSDILAKDILESLRKTDYELYERIYEKFIPYDYIVMFDDRSMQRILREVRTEDLAKSLVNANPWVRHKILHNMSDRAAAMLRDEVKACSKISDREILEAQDIVSRIAMRLVAKDDIVFASSSNIVV